MTIGFLDTDIASMEEFKKCVDAHPSHNWCIYIAVPEPTWGDELMLTEDAYEKGVQWLLNNKTDVLVTGRCVDEVSIKELVDREHKELTFFNSTQKLMEHLKDVPETPAEQGQAKLRSIHLTKHSEEQDALMAQALGGFLLKD